MASGTPLNWEIRSAMPAALDAVEDLIVEFRRRNGAPLDRVCCFPVELLLREALTNAVVHGSHGDRAMRVRCLIKRRDRRLFIAVQDEGPGFDWREALERIPEPCGCSGRGVCLIREYSTRLRFNRKGNTVAMMKQL